MLAARSHTDQKTVLHEHTRRVLWSGDVDCLLKVLVTCPQRQSVLVAAVLFDWVVAGRRRLGVAGELSAGCSR